MNCQNRETLENFILNSMQYINYLAKKKKDKMSKTITSFFFFFFLGALQAPILCPLFFQIYINNLS